MNYIVIAARQVVCEGSHNECVSWINDQLLDKKDDRAFSLYAPLSSHTLISTIEVKEYTSPKPKLRGVS